MTSLTTIPPMPVRFSTGKTESFICFEIKTKGREVKELADTLTTRMNNDPFEGVNLMISCPLAMYSLNEYSPPDTDRTVKLLEIAVVMSK